MAAKTSLLLASATMRQALAGGAWFSVAAGALVAVAVLAASGSSNSRLFWIGVAALVVAAAALVVRPPALTWTAAAFLGALAADKGSFQQLHDRGWYVPEPSSEWRLCALAKALLGTHAAR